MPFRDRTDAGRRLVNQLRPLDLVDPVVLALPRGGVPVAYEIAAALEAPLDVFVARKVGAPGRPEMGIGSVAEGGVVLTNPTWLRTHALSSEDWQRMVADERHELARMVRRYRGSRPLMDLQHRDVILVDDGLATGVTAEVALRALRSFQPHGLLLAAPVCAPTSMRRLAAIADEVICVISPTDFRAVGQWYADFRQTRDAEVVTLLDRAFARPRHSRTSGSTVVENVCSRPQ